MRTKVKLHYHTHAEVFSGAENMIPLFLQSKDLKSFFLVSFSYRYSKEYSTILNKRIKNFQGKIYPLHFTHLYSYEQLPFPKFIPIFIRRIFFLFINYLITYPLLIYQIIVIRGILVKTTPNILHINNSGYPGALSARAAAIAGWILGIPKIIMVVNNMAAGYAGHYSRWIDYPVDRIVARCVDVFITGSQGAATQLKKVLRLPKSRLRSIHNGSKLDYPSCTVEEKRNLLGLSDFKGVVFGVAALLVPRKGHHVLIDAVMKLVNKNKFLRGKFKILIAGSGPMKQSLVDFIEINNLNDCINFVGFQENIGEFMSVIDVLILPSIRDEDFPYVILEAMSKGKPVIASHLAGTPEQVVHNVTGILVKPCNLHELENAILKLINNSILRIDMGRAALERYKNNFTGKIALDNYISLYKELAKND